jgi:tripartite-type tricarboxylate transporter receptor subunit TctC
VAEQELDSPQIASTSIDQRCLIERRLDALPDIPAVAEFVPGYEASGWFGVGAPSNAPVEIIDKLNKEIDAGVADPKMKAPAQH